MSKSGRNSRRVKVVAERARRVAKAVESDDEKSVSRGSKAAGGKAAGRAKRKRGRPRKVVPYVDVASGERVEKIRLADIDVDDTTFRFRVNLRLGSLLDSIREDGQQFPVVLRKRPDDGRLQIISGFRRVTAIRKLGWDKVNAIVRRDLRDDIEAFKVSIIENEARQTYSDLDRAYAILAYRRMGRSNGEIEEIFRVGARQRQRLEELTTFPPELQEAVADGKVSSTNAVRLMQHKRKHPDTDVSQWIDWIGAHNATYLQLTSELKRAVSSDDGKPITVFTKRDKKGRSSIRLRPVVISQSLTTGQKEALVSDLKSVIAFVENL